MHCEESSSSTCIAAEVSSPAIVLPAGNYTTIRDRWTKWSANTVRGTGSQIAFERPDLQSAVADGLSWPTMLHTRDNLGVNDCIIAAEEKAAAALLFPMYMEKYRVSNYCRWISNYFSLKLKLSISFKMNKCCQKMKKEIGIG